MSDNDKTVFVNYEKGGQEPELERAYMELGKAYYEGRFEDPLPELLPLFDKITRLKKESEKDENTCPHCGSELKPGSLFCAQCGQRV